jgi:hypothetical protein
MPVDRQDHFGRIRGETPEAPPPEDAPSVSPALVSWLTDKFRPLPIDGDAVADGMDGALRVSHTVARVAGQNDVIAYLNSLVRTA